MSAFIRRLEHLVAVGIDEQLKKQGALLSCDAQVELEDMELERIADFVYRAFHATPTPSDGGGR